MSPTALYEAGTRGELGFALPSPAGWYRDERVFEAERLRLFARSWHLVADERELAAPGSYLATSVAGIPLAVVRGTDGVLRAFHNVCRHRGMTLLEGCGQVGRHLTCPYHQWSFRLDGSLARIPQGEAQFAAVDPADYPLHEAGLATWQGMVFVNPSASGPSLAESFGELDLRLAAFFEGELVEVARRSYEAPCNWKLLIENHVDVYHLWYLHSRSLHHYDHQRFAWESLGDNWWSLEPLAAASPLDRPIPWLRGPMAGGIGAYLLFPNLMLVTTPSYFATYDAQPLSATRTKLTLRIRAPEGTDPEPLVDDVRSFMAEDVDGCRRLQEATASPVFDVGPMAADHEEPIRRFHAALARSLVAELVP